MEIDCKVHGLRSRAAKNGDRIRCAQCNVDAVNRRRRELKVKAVEYKGGKCERCGYDKYVGALQFHHLDPAEKDFGIGHRGYTASWDKVKAELDKCAILCANCHAEEHGVMS